jgi:prephenate dehydratase/prephenate dehydrogenase
MTVAAPTQFDGGAGVAFLGPEGTYTHNAALALFGADVKGVPVDDIRDVFAAVDDGRASWGVVPVENSTEGSITVTLDALASSPLQICAEHLLRINHCLLMKPGASQEQITSIVSHQQSLGQCRQYLDQHFVGIARVPVSSNAEAARIALNTPGVAAIAGKTAATRYGLAVLAESIEDTHDNTTRFVLLGRACVTKPTGKDRTSLLISTPNEPGTLFHALEPFHRFGLSLTKLETRPSRRAAWSYAFYVDLDGHIEDSKVQSALQALKQLQLEVKWLGSYPQADADNAPVAQNASAVVERCVAEVVADTVQANAAQTKTTENAKDHWNNVSSLGLLQNKKIVIVGLGLIGGSVARAVSKLGCGGEIVAVGRNTAALQQAQDDGNITAWSIDMQAACANADLVVLGMPVLSIEQSLQELAPCLSSNTIVTDVASVKGAVVDAVRRVFGAVPANFVPGHPIAGSEQSGYAASKADLYQGRKVILTPLEHTHANAVELVAALWQAIGADVLTMSVTHHDEVLAATSHLPHLLAFALVDTLSQQGTREEIFRYAAGGFRDFTRIASSDPVMWRDIFLTNADATVHILDDYMHDLQRLRAVLLQRDGAELFKTFQRAKASRDVFLALNAPVKTAH